MTATALARYLTPPAVAELIGIDPAQVRGWIERGELLAFNLAERSGGRPRFKIDPIKLQAFLARRRVGPVSKTRRRRPPLEEVQAVHNLGLWP